MHLSPPFRAEHIGSLIRPPALFKAREQLEAGTCTLADVQAEEASAIRHVVQLQKDIGINTITDGEMTRAFFFDGVFDKLQGMAQIERPINTFKPYIPHIAFMYAAGIPSSPSVFCDAKIKRTTPFYVDEFKFLKLVVAPEEVKFIKITMCSPSWFHQRHGSDQTYDLNVYKNDTEYFDALGVAYREEIKELYDLGCRHIQFDDPTFCYFCSDNMISGMEAASVDHEALLDEYIRSINVCVKDRPDDLTVGVHTCRGNFRGIHFSEGGYDRIAFKLLRQLDVDTFYLEYDTERAGGFEPLKFLPLDKVVVLGLVSTKTPKMETKEDLKARVYEAVDVISQGNPKRSKEFALNQVCISTQCGFSSTWHGNPITEEDQKNKLSLLVETAKEIWKIV